MANADIAGVQGPDEGQHSRDYGDCLVLIDGVVSQSPRQQCVDVED